MPRAPRHALIWSADHRRYELYTRGQFEPYVQPADASSWLAWLGTVTSLAFHSPFGSLNVCQEARPRGGQYWYAYHTSHGRTRKRYLGPTARVTLARLEATARDLASASSPAAQTDSCAHQDVEQPLLVLAAKLTPPRLPHALVERPRLLSALDGALSTPLTLLSAAAGWGKTTLLAAWARQHREHVAWLSLDELDDSPTRFWVAVIAALRRCGPYAPHLGETALALLQSPQPPPLAACLSTLLNELEGRVTQPASTAPVVLVLDDYQVISDPAIHESLTFWLEHLPAYVRVVLASRVDPDLPLARLRVRGQLSELRAADLHFRPVEASALLQQAVRTPLSEDEVAALQRRTEGWAAGLQLAALSLRQRQQDDRTAWIAAWTGSQRYLLDYVQEEILSRQPDDLQRFLLHTAVLTRLSTPICQAVTDEQVPHTCQRMLELLERANLFLVPLDEERRWYRVHELFREALLAHLAAHEPTLLPQLHLRAARWYETTGEPQEAIAHALAAPDYAYAARLMERAAPRCWLRGEAQTVLTWLAALPSAVVWQHARLALHAMLRLLESLAWTTEASYARAEVQVEGTLAHLEGLLSQRVADNSQTGQLEVAAAAQEELAVIERRLRLLRGLSSARTLLRRGDQARLAQLARDLGGLAEAEEIGWQLIPLTIECWLTGGFRRESTRLLPRLLEVQQQAERAGDLLANLRTRSWLAEAYLRARAWPQVERECLAGLAQLAKSGVRSPSAGYLQSYLAHAYYAWNRLDAAAEAFHEVLRIGQDWQQVDLLTTGWLNLAEISLARSDLPAADQALCQAEELDQREPLAYLASPVAVFRVRSWLAAGEVEAARRWAEQAVFSPDPEHWDPNEQWAVRTLVLVHLAQHQYPQALELVERFGALLTRPGDRFSTIEWLALQVVALHLAGEREKARETLARLLALTEPAGDLRVYLDLGDPMRQALLAWRTALLQGQAQHPSITAYVSQLLSAFQQEQSNATRSLQTGVSGSLRALTPALTRREQDVLRLVATGASNQEIARMLMIELPTAKKHVSNLLDKLGATNRTQAIAQARARALL